MTLIYEYEKDDPHAHPAPAQGQLPPEVIRASAGSGKTYALSSRYIQLLHGQVASRSILATTFTRKAAGEILERVLLRLAKAAMDKDAAAELRQAIQAKAFSSQDAHALLRHLGRDLHRVNIATLDAFFSQMASSFWMELALPPSPALVAQDDPQITRARMQAIEAMLAQADLQVMADLLRRVHHENAGRSVTATIDRLISSLHETYRLAPSRALWDRLRPANLLEEQSLQQAIDALHEHAQAPGLPRSFIKAIPNDLQAFLDQDWEKFLKQGLSGKIAKDEPTYNRGEIDGQTRQLYLPLLDHARGMQVMQIARQTLATWELLRDFDVQFQAIRQQRHLVMFSDLPLKLSQYLGDGEADEPNPLSENGPAGNELAGDMFPQLLPGEGVEGIYFRLDGQVRHLLLDEFQDTSPLQWDVLRPLASEIVSDISQPRSFFCVGDVKQSIYSWRGGCSELFDQITDELHIDDQYIQSRDSSYRSSPVILAAVNTVFTGLDAFLTAVNTDAQVQAAAAHWLDYFHPHEAHKTELPGLVKLVTSSAAPPDESDDDEDGYDDTESTGPTLDLADAHGQYVAEYVQALVKQHPTRSLGVLVRTNKMVNQLIHRLQHLGVQASGEGGNPVTDDPAVGLILAAMKLADHPGDRVARHHVGMSPLAHVIGLPQSPSDGAMERFAHQVRLTLAQQGYPALVSQWAIALAPSCDSRNATRLSQLIEIAQRYQPLATPRPGDFIDHVLTTRVEEPNPAPVRVMTIHKAKGLEFDIVVLPELHQTIGGVSTQQAVYVARQSPTGPVTGVYRRAKNAIRDCSPLLVEAWQQEMTRRLRDDLGAFYVGLTRARQAMHLIVPPLKYTPKGKVSSKGLTDRSLAAILRHTLKAPADETPLEAQTLVTVGRDDWDDQAITQASLAQDESSPARASASSIAAVTSSRLEVSLPGGSVSTRNWRVIAPSQLEAGAQVNVADLLNQTGNRALAMGSLIHAMFQQIDWLDHPDAPPITGQAVAQQMPALASPPDMPAIDDAITTFDRMIRHEAIHRALCRPAVMSPDGQVELWRERPFAVRLDAALVRGVLDRVVIQRDARGSALHAQVLDYKTDRLPSAGLPVLIEHYRPQLAAYRQAVAAMLDLPLDRVSTALLLLEPGQVVTLH